MQRARGKPRRPPAIMKTLSVVIPAYNEARFVATLLERVKAVDLSPLGFGTELIVVDDGSTDGTAEIVEAIPAVRLLRLPAHGGKGRAVRAGIAAASGELLIIQDADLEYDPRDFVPMIQAWLDHRATVIYGSRYLRGGRHPNQSLAAYAGGRSLSLVCRLFTGTYLSDTVTALKLFPREEIAALPLQTSGFEIDLEITARLIARGRTIAEVPIRYYPRSRAEGKKVGARDWVKAIATLYRFRAG